MMKQISSVSIEDMDRSSVNSLGGMLIVGGKGADDRLAQKSRKRKGKKDNRASIRSYANMLENNEKRKKQLLKELTPYLTIKDRLKIRSFIKALLESIIIMLIWFSTIFKQDVYSFPLFLMVIFYSYKRSGSALVVVRTTISIMLFVEYLSQVIDFSSYNS